MGGSKMENEQQRNSRKTLVGMVVSDKMDKTIVVEVTMSKRSKFRKVVKTTKRYKVHDENNECEVGDRVEIAETRHLSKDKYFRLVRIVEKKK